MKLKCIRSFVSVLMIISALVALTSCDISPEEIMKEMPNINDMATQLNAKTAFKAFAGETLKRVDTSLETVLGESSETYRTIMITVDDSDVCTITSTHQGARRMTFTVDDEGTGHISATNITVTVVEDCLVFTRGSASNSYSVQE